jgi:hypothetical protein
LDKVSESSQLPSGIQPGPHTAFLTQLIVSLRRELSVLAHRVNEVLPKDGSEPQRMISVDCVDFPEMSADVDNADPGFYSRVKFTLTGGAHTLSGVADGAGQEGVGGRLITLVNTSATALTLTVAHADVGSDAANRFLLPAEGDVDIDQDESMTFWYDLAALRWRVA